MNKYDIGDMIRLRGSFVNSAGVAVDPSSVTLQYRRWFDDTASYTSLVYGVGSIVRASTGEYYHDASFTVSGEWRYRWNGFGDNASAAEGQFMIRVRSVGG